MFKLNKTTGKLDSVFYLEWYGIMGGEIKTLVALN